MPIRLLLISLALLIAIPSSASASLADEQHHGQTLAAQVQSGAVSCGDLSHEDFDHIGEYVMGRALGSTTAHAAMNERMRLMIGDQAEGRMHQLMGARFAGCTTAAAGNGYGTTMGPGTMGDTGRHRGWGAMMRSRDWSWMMDTNWRTMNRHDWQQIQHRWLPASTMPHHGWSTLGIAAIAIGSALLAATLAIVVVRRRPVGHPPSASAPS